MNRREQRLYLPQPKQSPNIGGFIFVVLLLIIVFVIIVITTSLDAKTTIDAQKTVSEIVSEQIEVERLRYKFMLWKSISTVGAIAIAMILIAIVLGSFRFALSIGKEPARIPSKPLARRFDGNKMQPVNVNSDLYEKISDHEEYDLLLEKVEERINE